MEVKILVSGCLPQDNSQKIIQPTITLVQGPKFNLIIDPGWVNKKTLQQALKKYNLKPTQINWVGLTHSHLDHYYWVSLFEKAQILDFWGLWGTTGKLKTYHNELGPNIKIIKTPGHSYDSITFLIKTRQGYVAVCGDVFWKKELINQTDPYAQNLKQLKVSRQKILKIADWIVPGHGPVFKSPFK